jgi:hypothetical protein
MNTKRERRVVLVEKLFTYPTDSDTCPELIDVSQTAYSLHCKYNDEYFNDNGQNRVGDLVIIERTSGLDPFYKETPQHPRPLWVIVEEDNAAKEIQTR